MGRYDLNALRMHLRNPHRQRE